VVIDIDETRTSFVQLQELRDYVPALHGDAAVTKHLQEAGLQHPSCASVVALTDDNEVNLKIAITSKLLNPKIKVICRSDSHDVEANMASFGTDHIVDPFDTFAARMAIAFQAPCHYLLQRWLTGPEGGDLSEPVYPPREGPWIVCGYGRFGKAIYARLIDEGIDVTVVEAHPERTGHPDSRFVSGRGTEAVTLQEAGITSAVGLVAGTDDDANNLSIVMTARELNPDVFVVVRQNQHDNREIIAAVRAEMVMHPSAIIADNIRALLATPMLHSFMSLALREDDAWACELVARISALVKETVPLIREWALDDIESVAMHDYLDHGGRMSIGEMLCDPWQRSSELKCIVLLIERNSGRLLLPDAQTPLQAGDRLLLCGDRKAFTRMQWTVSHRHTLDFIKSGVDQPQGWLWRRLMRMR
jgi:Trk K+ transport system NAD-binding subunit